MTLNPALDAGPSPLASARHLALPGPRRARLEDRVRIAAHRSTGRTDVRPPLFAVPATRRTRAETPGTTPSAAQEPAPRRSSGQRAGKQLISLALGITALGALLALGAAGAFGALLVAAG